MPMIEYIYEGAFFIPVFYGTPGIKTRQNFPMMYLNTLLNPVCFNNKASKNKNLRLKEHI
jgi:hypothetical protein